MPLGSGLIAGRGRVKSLRIMDRAPAPTLEQAPLPMGDLAAVLDWWRGAGVDCAFVDTPRRWLQEPAAPAAPAAAAAASPRQIPPAPAAAPERPRIGGDPAAWPQDLEAFRRWWVEDPALDPAAGHGPAPRVPPRGQAGAALMVLVPMPEEQDTATLLSGPQGRLVAAMARAMGLAPAALYLASALPRPVTLPDWRALAVDGLGAVLRHHLALAAPQRILVLGRDILPLIEHDPAQAPPAIHHLEVGGRQVPVLASYAPGHLIDHARLRAGLWRQWLDFTDDG